ncbi:MAG: hypothetical protein ACYSUG_07195, partial [Planctomycetota bacterium]
FIFPISGASGLMALYSYISELIECTIDIAIVVYLLFFGKCLLNVIHQTSTLELDDAMEKQNYAEILIRFVGVWWLWKIICQIFRLISGMLHAWVLMNPQWFSEHFDRSEEVSKKLQELIGPTIENLHWLVLSNVILYAFLAWYFLKHGKLFINLLNRRWTGKNGEEPNQ